MKNLNWAKIYKKSAKIGITANGFLELCDDAVEKYGPIHEVGDVCSYMADDEIVQGKICDGGKEGKWKMMRIDSTGKPISIDYVDVDLIQL